MEDRLKRPPCADPIHRLLQEHCKVQPAATTVGVGLGQGKGPGLGLGLSLGLGLGLGIPGLLGLGLLLAFC